MLRSFRPLPSSLLAIALLALLPLASAWAQSPPEKQRGGNQARNQEDRRGSLSDAVRRVERNTRGEVLSAERVQYDGRDMHRVKVVDDRGRVRVFMQEPTRREQDASRRDDSRRPAPRPSTPTRDDDD